MDPEQTAPRSSLIWVHTVCHGGFLNIQQMRKQTTFVAIGALRVNVIRENKIFWHSKNCVKRPFSKRQKLVFKTTYRLMHVKNIAECSIKLPVSFVYFRVVVLHRFYCYVKIHICAVNNHDC